jgi:hypothetical protein
MTEDCFGDSLTVHFVGGPFDGDEDVVEDGSVLHKILVFNDPSGHYLWRDGKYYWTVAGES